MDKKARKDYQSLKESSLQESRGEQRKKMKEEKEKE
jgi:hypothetical protein